MRYDRFRPGADLQDLIDDIWVQDHPEETPDAPPTHVLPVARAELIFHYRDPFAQLGGSTEQILPTSMVLGQRTRPMQVRATGRTGLVIVGLKPSAAPLLVGDAGRELRDRPEPIETFVPRREVRRLEERLSEAGVIWSAVQELPEVVADPQAKAMNHFVELEHDDVGTFRTLSTPFRIVDADIQPRGPAPELGQHTEEVLLECGMDWEEIAGLRESGVLG